MGQGPLSETIDKDYIHDYLLFQVERGARQRFGPNWAENQEVLDRLNLELGVIGDKGFESYFLFLWMLIDECRSPKRKIPVGPGRGSSGGSLVAYCLGITDLDPLKYGLLFERFLSEDRDDPPDIDVDFSQARRQEVLELARDLFGRERTIQIGAFQRYGYKEILKTICPIAGMPLEKQEELRKLIPENPMGGQKTEKEFHRIYDEVTAVREWLDRPEHAEWKAAIMAADGGYQHMGRHAAGILVMDQESQEFVPLASPDGETYVTAWDMYDIERLGLMKQDLLGLRTLDIIDTACKLAGIEVGDIPMELDEAGKKLLAEGHTLGVFQLENWGFTQVTKRLAPSKIDHIFALNALFRPGCLEAYVWAKNGEIVETSDPSQIPDKNMLGVKRLNMVDVYIERRHKRMKLEYLHPDLEPILAETEGIILYQEQAMRIARDLAGFQGGKPEKLRKAIGKKRQKEMDALEAEFIDGMKAKGYEAALARQIWDNIAAAARYSWNKSHSVMYGAITWQCAWLKANKPVAWYASLLQSLNKKEKIAEVISEMKLQRIPLAPPLINHSVGEFQLSPEKDAVMFGLSGIAGLGDAALNAIIEEREEGGPFLGLKDFLMRCSGVPIHIVESLIAAGAFDNLPEDRFNGWTRAFMLANCRVIKANTKLKKKQHPLEERVPDEMEMLEREREILGFFITSDPVGDLRAKWGEQYDVQSLCIGTVQSIRTKVDRKGNEMAFVQIDDPERGRRSTTWFASVWRSAYGVKKGAIVVLQGADETWNSRVSFNVDRMLQVL